MIAGSFPPLSMSLVEFEGVSSTRPTLRFRTRSDGLETLDITGSKVPDLPEINDRLAFGGPLLTPIGVGYSPESNDLNAFLANTQDRWFLAHMALDFLESDGPRLESATVQVNLGDNGVQTDTTAFSIFPIRAVAPVGGTVHYAINPTAFGISIIGIDGDLARGGKVFLRGAGELSSRVTWTFKRRWRQPLEDSTRLVMVIRSPKGCNGKMEVKLNASVRTGKIFRYRYETLPDGSTAKNYEKTF
jgi:hypothetical protein